MGFVFKKICFVCGVHFIKGCGGWNLKIIVVVEAVIFGKNGLGFGCLFMDGSFGIKFVVLFLETVVL